MNEKKYPDFKLNNLQFISDSILCQGKFFLQNLKEFFLLGTKIGKLEKLSHKFLLYLQ